MSFAVPPDRDVGRRGLGHSYPLGAGDLDALIATPGALRSMFQPIVRVSGERWTLQALECLTRAPDAPSPTDAAHLFAVARSLGGEVALDRACIARALESARMWNVGADLFLNVHPRTLETDASFPDFLAATAMRADIAPERLTIEITEHRRDCTTPGFQSAVRTVRELGIRIAFDDTGTGSHDRDVILACRPDIVKLEGRLCREARLATPVRRELGALAEAARSVGSTVIAEGVEHPHDATVMGELGIDLAQGNHFCPPLHAEHAGDAAAVVARRAILASRRSPTPALLGAVLRSPGAVRA